MPAIAAKAAKRLPPMPHCKRRKLNRPNLPGVGGNAIEVARHIQGLNRAGVSRQLVNKIAKMPPIFGFARAKQKAGARPALCSSAEWTQ
ncbi:hypothetical protein [uncultured Bradyrhizobium sp.]|uniref:hypothetical protein n=1 Tax=uncultured Bradyrhizobium sp. TaxID=199684 RepID=UPI0035CA582B